MKNIINCSFLMLALLLFSCAKDGAIGPQGKDGINGAEGIDGVNGNANVITYLFNEPQWSNSDPIIMLDMTGILTTEVIENDVILVYLQRNFSNIERVFQIPGWVHGKFPDYPTQMITPYFTDSEGGAGSFQIPEHIYIIARSIDDTTISTSVAIPLSWIKVVIIKSTNTISSKTNPSHTSKDHILNELKKAGIDINDYQAVLNHYGIMP